MTRHFLFIAAFAAVGCAPLEGFESHASVAGGSKAQTAGGPKQAAKKCHGHPGKKGGCGGITIVEPQNKRQAEKAQNHPGLLTEPHPKIFEIQAECERAHSRHLDKQKRKPNPQWHECVRRQWPSWPKPAGGPS